MRDRANTVSLTVLTENTLTDTLAERILGWKICPDRFIRSGRAWIPKHRFKPLARLEDAFLLLDRVADVYRISSVNGVFTAEVQVGGKTATLIGEAKARTITLAIAQALRIEVPR